MQNTRMALLIYTMTFLLVGALVFSSRGKAQTPSSENEHSLWNLEHDYFRYVEANDIKSYLNLWHTDFLGWPSVSPTPLHKDHITDWITTQTRKGLAFKLIEFRPASLQVTGNFGVACYWVTYKFIDKDGNGTPYTIRITHT